MLKYPTLDKIKYVTHYTREVLSHLILSISLSYSDDQMQLYCMNPFFSKIVMYFFLENYIHEVVF